MVGGLAVHAAIGVLRAGRRWPCALGTAMPEIETCPPRRSRADGSAAGRAEQSGAVRFPAIRLKPAEFLVRLGAASSRVVAQRRAADPSALALLAMSERAHRHDLPQPCQGAARSESVAERRHLIRRQVVRVAGHAPPALRGMPLRPPALALAGRAPRALGWRHVRLCPAWRSLKMAKRLVHGSAKF